MPGGSAGITSPDSIRAEGRPGQRLAGFNCCRNGGGNRQWPGLCNLSIPLEPDYPSAFACISFIALLGLLVEGFVFTQIEDRTIKSGA